MFEDPVAKIVMSWFVLHQPAVIACDINVAAPCGERGGRGRSFSSLLGSRGRLRVSGSGLSDRAGEDAYHVADEFPGDLALEPNIFWSAGNSAGLPVISTVALSTAGPTCQPGAFAKVVARAADINARGCTQRIE